MESTTVDPKSVQALKPSQWIRLIMTYLSIPLILLICGWDFSCWQAWVFSLLIVTAGIGGRMWAERRHPGYAGNILPLPGIVLALGSVWTLIPAALALVIAVIRTALEDRTLQEELPGYLGYARRVRFRLVPGIYTLCNAVTLAIITSSLASCGGRLPEASREPQVIASPRPTAVVTPTAPSESFTQSTSATPAARYGFPTQIDPTRRYLFYLHGRILEDQGLPAISPEYGEYQYQEILSVLESYGYVVISEQRPKNADGWKYAQRTARQVTELLTTGVPPGSITVVGASKGASIAAVASSLVDNTEVNYVLLGSCHPTLIDEWKQEGLTLSGNVLAIYDFADVEYSGSCEELFSLSEGKGLGRHDEILLHVGTGHGILYKPLPEWVLPTVKWANQE